MIKQSPFSKKLLVCDMDGTLLNGRNEVSSENRTALEYFVHGGGLFTIATGRTVKGIARYVEELPVNMPVIVMNGAQIFDFKLQKSLWKSCLGDEAENTVIELLTIFPGLGIEIFSEDGVYVIRENDIIEEHRSREMMHKDIFEPGNVPKPWYKLAMGWERDKLENVNSYLCGKSELLHSVFTELCFLDLLNAGTTKGLALDRLMEIFEVPVSNVIAVGDNLNDLEMIKRAGMGVAVENAHEELKKYAGFCCCHHDNHAIAQVVRWIEERHGDGSSV